MSGYITVDDFRLRALLPTMVLDAIETAEPGWLQAQIDVVSAEIDARLAKRYVTPIPAVIGQPYPAILGKWVVDLVSLNAWLKRGVSSTDEAFQEYKAKAERAYTEMREAADADQGLFELPYRVTGPSSISTITRGTPRVYSEQSPYVAFDRQARVGRSEDDFGNGSSA